MEDKIETLLSDVESLEAINGVFARMTYTGNECCITYVDTNRYLEHDIFFDVDENKVSIPQYDMENVPDIEDELSIPPELFISSMSKFIELIKLVNG